MSSIKPISPSEVAGYLSGTVPDNVIAAVNNLIALGPTHPTITERAIMAQGEQMGMVILSEDINFNAIAAVYRDAGWKIEIDRPGYNESYSAFMKFIPKK